MAIINNEKEYIQYLYGKCALCDVDNVNNYIYDYVQNQGFGIYMNSNLYGTTYQMCIFVPGYINGSQYICTFNSFYTHKYVYVPIAILNGNNKTILSNNTFYNCPGAAREVIGQSNTEYPIYIEPFVS